MSNVREESYTELFDRLHEMELLPADMDPKLLEQNEPSKEDSSTQPDAEPVATGD